MKLQIDLELLGHSRIAYHYRYDAGLSDFFSKTPFYAEFAGVDLRSVPVSVLVIPFLSNVLPVSWFIGFDVCVREIDEDFADSMTRIKHEFSKHYPSLQPHKSSLQYDVLTRNRFNGSRTAALFSGGVDSFTTALRHLDERPDLITVHGADIGIHDNGAFLHLNRLIDSTAALQPLRKYTVTANLREFYSVRVNELIEGLDWWGKVQHALALTGVVAPLSFVNRYHQVYIASSASAPLGFGWGSTPRTDEMIRWSDVRICHDAAELSRAQKVVYLADFVRHTGNDLQIKVCYSNRTTLLNCSRCDKCLRTILLIILAGGDPNRFGFYASEDVYPKILKTLSPGFESDMGRYQWLSAAEKIRERPPIFVFRDEQAERRQLGEILERITENSLKSIKKPSALKRLRYLLQLKFPGVHRRAVQLLRMINGQR